MDWMQLVTLIVGLFGGGSLMGVLTLRHRKRIEDRAANVSERTADLSADDAAERWWQERLRAQAELIVEPLRAEVAGLRDEVRTLREEVSEVRTRYWRAVHLIRALYAWIAQNVPDGTPPPPQAHVDIVGDI